MVGSSFGGGRIVGPRATRQPRSGYSPASRLFAGFAPLGDDLRACALVRHQLRVRAATRRVASHDTIVTDAYATSLFGLTPDDIGYIRLGAEMGLGTADWREVKVAEITI